MKHRNANMPKAEYLPKMSARACGSIIEIEIDR